jgi:16S rRNA (uracil1498-N3)-methyltransferase
MHTAFHPDFSAKTKTLVLSEEESRHLVKVLRHTDGQELELCNGKGIRAIGKITLAHPKKCEVEIVAHTFEEKPKNTLHLAIAPTKNMDRLEWMIEKATEIGVDKITLLKCKNNERKVVKMERLEKILLSAMKQSQRYYLPELIDLTPIQKFMEKHPNGGIAHCYDNDSNKEHIANWKAEGPILIGPEGDFTLEEVNLAKENGYTTIDLGKNRLRTETAAVFVVSVLKGLR